jgi:hypothetical protein
MAAIFGGKRRTETAMLGFFLEFFGGERRTETAMLCFFLVEEFGASVEWKQR